jgi:dihydrofolate reductase
VTERGLYAYQRAPHQSESFDEGGAGNVGFRFDGNTAVTEIDPVIALVVGIAENGVIGREGDLPWRLPSDLKHFRRITMGKPLVMGRKTFASLPKVLDGRDNIVVTRDPLFAATVTAKGAIAARELAEALRIARGCAAVRGADEIMVIGGAEIFGAALPLAERIYLTRVHAALEGDVFFPETDFRGWREVSHVPGARIANDEYGFTFLVLERRHIMRTEA